MTARGYTLLEPRSYLISRGASRLFPGPCALFLGPVPATKTPANFKAHRVELRLCWEAVA